MAAIAHFFFAEESLSIRL